MNGMAMGGGCRGKLTMSGHSVTLGLPKAMGVDGGRAVRIVRGTPTIVRIEPVEAPRRRSNFDKVADVVTDRTMDRGRVVDHAAALAFARPLFERASYDRPIIAHTPFLGVPLVAVDETDVAGFSGLRVEVGTRPA